ncbi:MAG: TonB-dependent receptor [Draconibacterium sp.]
MKNLFIICVIILLYYQTNAQNIVKGKITNQNNEPLSGATVFIPELNKGTVADNNGNYELLNLPDNKVRIQFSFVGYNNEIKTLNLEGRSIKLDIVLRQTIVATEEIVVSGGYNSTQHENAVKIEMLKLDSRYMEITPNFTETLVRIPGVDMISKGSGVSKPVIRGLSMNDILVLNNGVRFENYQYSSHHPLGIDEFGIRDVEVIKGPASLLYGSDAIGGVINFIKERPAPIESVVGDYNLQLFSNTLGVTNNLGVKGASKKFFGGIRAGQKSNADFLQGGGTFAPNSRFNEISIKSNAGFTDKIGSFKVYYDYNNQKLGLVEDEAIDAITERGRKNDIWYQEFNTHLLSSQNKLYFGKFKLDVNSAFQNTELVHFAGLNEFELQMKLATLSYETKLYLPSGRGSEFILGFQGFNQRNTNINDRETILLPNATTNNNSVFGLIQVDVFEKLKLQTGIRYDYKTIESQSVGLPADIATYRPSLSQSYGSFSGSVGAVYTLSEGVLLRANFAAAYRTPNLAELTSNGQHELRYEIGNPDLVSENAYETDVSFHYHRDNITFDIAGFYNTLDNYIFIAPTGEETSSGIGIYKYKQTNSRLFGGEAGFHFHPVDLKWLHFEGTFSSVTGKQENGDYLPFIPANKLRFDVSAQKEKLLFFEKAYVSVNSSWAFSQNNPAPEESPTDSYNLLDISLGGDVKMNNQYISFVVSMNNIMDTKYIDHLSTLKEVNIYNLGRNIALSLKIPFGAKLN